MPATSSTSSPTKKGAEEELDSPEFWAVDFVEPGGATRRVTVLEGQNLMDAALAAGVQGIIGQCGGAINCATCLCDFDPKQLLRLPPQHPDETELLQYVDEASTNSRLACQLLGSPAMQGLVARVVVSISTQED